jgi:hypothetical protein
MKIHVESELSTVERLAIVMMSKVRFFVPAWWGQQTAREGQDA